MRHRLAQMKKRSSHLPEQSVFVCVHLCPSVARTQWRDSNSHAFARRYSTVFSTPWRMVSFGFQPSERTFFVSRKMNGLSPIQPRSPPVYLRSGLTPSLWLIQPIESFTSQYSSVPRL